MTFMLDFIHFMPKSVGLHEILLISQCEMTKAHIQKEFLIQGLNMLSSICQMILAADLPVGKTKVQRIRE